MEQFENDKPFSNGNYDNNCGEEINSVPTNESGEEINNAELISKRSKKIAKAITSSAVILAMIALLAPVFSRACAGIKAMDFSKMFSCEAVEQVVYDSSIECLLQFACLDEETQTVVEGEINVKDYGEEVIIALFNDSERYEKTITAEIKNNEYRAVFQGLTADSTYTLTVKIADYTLLEQAFSTLPKEQQN